MEERSLTVNGIKMRWLEQGEGRALVFIHGIPTSPHLWRHVLPLIEDARCLAWEMVGYGASIPQGRNRDISVARQADYLVDWMRELGLERPLLVGHDLGGGVAQIAAARNADMLGGLVLINSICYDSWPVPSVKAMRAAGGIVEMLPKGFLRPVFTAFMQRGHDNSRRAKESLEEHWRYYDNVEGPEAFVRQVRSLNVRDTLAVAPELPRLRLPVRLVWGASDPFQKIGYGYRLAYDLRARLDHIEGGRHFVPEDHPDRVAAAVADLLKDIESGVAGRRTAP